MDTAVEPAPLEPVVEAPVAPATPAPPAEVAAVVAPESGPAPFVSLYDTAPTAILAVVLGVGIVAGVLYVATASFRERTEHRALTRFVVSMVAIMVGVYVSDMLIAGPTAELLGESERNAILSFVKDTALMIFAFYFGTKSAEKAAE